MVKWKIPDIPKWVLNIIIFVMALIQVSDYIPGWIENYKISRLDYNLEFVIPNGISEEEWLKSEHIDFEGVCITGNEYHRISKSNSLEAASIFNQYCAVSSGGIKDFDNFENFAPVLFCWQCEFDFIQGKLLSYLSQKKNDDWCSFLKTKLDIWGDTYRIIYEEAFNSAFNNSYGNWTY